KYDESNGVPSYLQTDSIATLKLTGLIAGWVIAMEQMRVGDRVEVLVPYEAAYGSSSVGKILPYSVLRFEMELRDIPAYEIK
ncbi:MAG: FKBP-type peptidyl-prolyl cis-trans isomerase, partial [Muribaculaceae bacterium]|nr:FKBP-type peptidyl-prolyl cis-trans isomerase [Muribaculaceae bacterium]